MRLLGQFIFFTIRFHKYKKAFERIQGTKSTINVLGHFAVFFFRIRF